MSTAEASTASLARPAGPVRAPALAAVVAALARCWREDAARRVLWLPVGLGTGIAIYFALPAEPPPIPTVLLALGGAALALRLVGRRRGGVRAAAALAVAVLAGLVLALERSQRVAAPVLPRAGVYGLEGRVVAVEPRGRRFRLLLEEVRIDGLEPAQTPVRVRLGVGASAAALRAGDVVRLRARLMPPAAPFWPGGFDFARRAWFERIGAIGWSLGAPERLAAGEVGWGERLAAWRRQLAERVRDRIGGVEGEVAAALLTGLRGGIPGEVWEAMQRSGLAHLLAISGLHLGLVAATAWLLVRYGLALIPALALRWSLRRLAAVASLAAACAYLLLSGAPVPTRRAFITLALALLALLLGRSPFSMRLVALAAALVLVLEPEALTGASFQMSFAAVVALVAVFEGREGRSEMRGAVARLLAYPRLVLLTTLVAGLATLPFAAWHFGRIASWGMVANLLAVPLTAFWIVPAGFAALLALPLGLDGPLLDLMGRGIGVLLAIARTVAAWPGASLDLPPPPTAALLLYVAGGLWLALWRARWRWLGLVPLALGLALAVSTRPPQLLVAPGAQALAVRGEDGAWLEEWRRDGFRREQWRRALAVRRLQPLPEVGAVGPVRCDPAGCVVALEGVRIAWVRRSHGVVADCRRAALVITALPRLRCPDGTPVLDGRSLWRLQGAAIRIEDGRIAIEGVRPARGERPWVR